MNTMLFWKAEALHICKYIESVHCLLWGLSQATYICTYTHSAIHIEPTFYSLNPTFYIEPHILCIDPHLLNINQPPPGKSATRSYHYTSLVLLLIGFAATIGFGQSLFVWCNCSGHLVWLIELCIGSIYLSFHTQTRAPKHRRGSKNPAEHRHPAC